jgi:hypothetical protein
MAAAASPYGLKAVNHLGGTPYAGSTTLYYRLLLDMQTNLYNGTIVSSRSRREQYNLPPSSWNSRSCRFHAGTVGVFVGCTYTDPDHGQHSI